MIRKEIGVKKELVGVVMSVCMWMVENHYFKREKVHFVNEKHALHTIEKYRLLSFT
jgi:hypothetical protein